MRDIENLLFITQEDLSGGSGANIATKEIIHALSKFAKITLISPTNSQDSNYNILSVPDKSRWGIFWHIIVQPIIIIKLIIGYRNYNPDAVVARYHITLLTPGIICLVLGKNYIILIRGRPFLGTSPLQYSLAVINIYINYITSSKMVVAYEQVQRDLCELPFVSSDKIVISPNGVDVEKFQPNNSDEVRFKYDIPESTFAIGLVANLQKWHMGKELIEAAEELIDDIELHVLIVGDGPQREPLVRMVQKKDLTENVTFTGYIDHSKVDEYMSACDVLFGVTPVGNPIKCYEYLACERPIITRANPEFEFVDNEKLGVTVEEPDTKGIVDAIQKLYNKEEHERQQMGKRGRQYVLQHHTWDELAKDIIGDYE